MFILTGSGDFAVGAIAGQSRAADAAATGDLQTARRESQQAGFFSAASELAFAGEKEAVGQTKKTFI